MFCAFLFLTFLSDNRNAEPFEWLKKAKTLFIDRMSELVSIHSTQVVRDLNHRAIEVDVLVLVYSARILTRVDFVFAE